MVIETEVLQSKPWNNQHTLLPAGYMIERSLANDFL